jgi:spore coat protein JC
MWIYQKKLQYPVNIRKRDLKMAKYLVTQYGGPYGELAAEFK